MNPPPDDVKKIMDKAWALIENKDLSGAVAVYTEALRDKTHPQLLSNLGALWNHLGEYDKAIADFDAALGLDPSLAPAWLNRGEAYRRKGDESRALADFHKAVAADPRARSRIPPLPSTSEAMWAHFEEGCRCHEQGRREDAIKSYTAAIECNPGFDKAYVNRAAAYQELERYDEAAAGYTEALQANPKMGVAHVFRQRAVCHSRLGRTESALTDIEEALRLDPQNPDALSILNSLKAAGPPAKEQVEG